MNRIIITNGLRGYLKHPDGTKIDLKIIYKDGDLENLDYDNITYDFLNKPVECKNKKGFYYIPFHSRYLINVDGILWDTKKNKISKYYISKKIKNDTHNRKLGYYHTRAKRDNGLHTHCSRHRLLALTFHKYDIDPDLLVTNHINGTPGDDRIDNLELITKKENLIHAIQNGLMPNSVKAIYALDCITKKEYKFISVAEAARFFKFTHSKLAHRLRKGIVRYEDNIIFKLDDGKPWPDPLPPIMYGMGVRVPVVAISTINNKAYIFDTIMHAQKLTLVNTTTIADRIKDKSNKPSKNYIFMSLDDFRNYKPL